MRIWLPDFKQSNNHRYNDSYYDVIDDYPLIEASFLEQYGIRLRGTDDLPWDEFCTYLAGLNEKTPLGKIVSIRSEKDSDIIKHMTPEQRKIRMDWNRKIANNYSKDEMMQKMKALSAAMTQAFSK